jgi:hypothetical protein
MSLVVVLVWLMGMDGKKGKDAGHWRPFDIARGSLFTVI